MNLIIDKLGLEGYARYFLLLEACAQKIQKIDGQLPEPRPFEFHTSQLAKILRMKSKHSGFILGTFQECAGLKLQCTDNIVTIEIPKLWESFDRDQRRARKQRGSGAAVARLRVQSTETDIPWPQNGQLPPLAKIWNENCGNLKKVSKCGATRQRAISARWKENPDPEYWAKVVKRIAQSNFCTGKNTTKWSANFDFLIKPETQNKVLEGNYDDRKILASEFYASPIGA